MSQLRNVLVVISGLALASCANPTEDVGVTVAAGGRTPPPPIARPCRADGFFVEVPVQLPVLWSDTSWTVPVVNDLNAAANAAGYPWFCGTGQTTCPASGVNVDFASLLPQRSSPAERADGHLRFFRVRYLDAATGQELQVRPRAQCAAVALLRTSFAGWGRISSTEIYVGRECDAMAMDVQAEATDDMLAWHLDRLGLDRVLATTPPDPMAPVIDIALLDSGIDATVGAAIGVASTLDLSGSGSGGLHPHGTGMAVLLRQVAPDAAIHDYRVIDSNGQARTGTLARGIDEALFGAQANPGVPLVLNLSLGWPAQLGATAELTGDSCSTHEDPVGESVRYGLHLANLMEDDATRPVFVASASGNQPGPDPSTPVFPYSPVMFHECGAQVLPGEAWFYPGYWHQVDSCPFGGSGNVRLTFSVGAVDDRDRVSGIAIPDAESPLVAPGQHVYASHPAASSAPAGPFCAGSPVPPSTSVSLPRSFTGTSVSTVLTSAAAARAQVERSLLSQPALDSDALARLLYLTGRSMCDSITGAARLTPGSVPVRRLEVARLVQAIKMPECDSVITCAEAAPGGELISASLLHDCRYELEDCGLETVDGSGNLDLNCPRPEAVPWPAVYANSAPMCRSGVIGGTPWVDSATCPPSGCPYGASPYMTLLGSLGPQPTGPTCPDCIVYPYVADATLILELNPDFDGSTTFAQPYVVAKGLVGGSTEKEYYADISGAVPMGEWVPGASLEIETSFQGMDPSFDWSSAKVTLVVIVNEPNHQPATDYSPLRIEL